MEKEKYSYYKEDHGDISDDIFANLDGKHGSNSGTDNPGETYGWEAERPIYTEFKGEGCTQITIMQEDQSTI